MADATPEKQAAEVDAKKDDQLRVVIADTYTFVRSREISKVIAAFTFDHYIDEAKRAIKEDRILRTASGIGAGTRPSQLTAMEKLQEDFYKNFAQAQERAEASDKAGEQGTEEATKATELLEENIVSDTNFGT